MSLTHSGSTSQGGRTGVGNKNGVRVPDPATVSTVLNEFAILTSPGPSSTTSTLTPSFTWTDPSNASNYTYQSQLSLQYGNTIWQIPGSNSSSAGFSSAYTSIPTWDTDPTGGGSAPSSSLTTGTSYQ